MSSEKSFSWGLISRGKTLKKQRKVLKMSKTEKDHYSLIFHTIFPAEEKHKISVMELLENWICHKNLIESAQNGKNWKTTITFSCFWECDISQQRLKMSGIKQRINHLSSNPLKNNNLLKKYEKLKNEHNSLILCIFFCCSL